MSFESKEHYWVIVFEPSEANCHFSADTRLYWGTKKGGAAWTEDLAQATHFKTPGGARSNMADRNSKYRRPVWHGVIPNDKVYVGEVESVATVTEVVQGDRAVKKHAGISEKEFVEAVRELYPNALFHQLDEKDFDDVWIRGIGYWEADRVLYSRSDMNIRMWRNFGGYDRHFKNLAVFKEWLKNAHTNNRKFEETSEATK